MEFSPFLRQNALDFINQWRKLPLTDNERFIWVFHTNIGGYLKSKGNMWFFVIVKQCRWLYINFYAFFLSYVLILFLGPAKVTESTPKMAGRGYLQWLGLGFIYINLRSIYLPNLDSSTTNDGLKYSSSPSKFSLIKLRLKTRQFRLRCFTWTVSWI